MPYQLSQTSADRLKGVHPQLIKVVVRALDILAGTKGPDFSVLEGVRSDEQCFINWGKGRTAAECASVGMPAHYAQPHLAKVTWLGHPLSCNHRKKPDGYGHAVDLFPGTWEVKAGGAYDQMSKAMFQAAKELGVKLRWGADWNCNGKPREKGETDNPHFELA